MARSTIESAAEPGEPVPAEQSNRLSGARTGLRRTLWLIRESVVVSLIRVCGVSAILFVVAIFVFILLNGLPFLAGGFNAREFFTTSDWYPTSQSNPRFGILSLMVGTAAVTVLAMAFAIPFGLSAAVLISEFCGRARSIAR